MTFHDFESRMKSKWEKVKGEAREKKEGLKGGLSKAKRKADQALEDIRDELDNGDSII